MLPRHFVKMAGGGNDFLLFEADGRKLSAEEKHQIALLCRRGLSVGADGALFLSGGADGRVRLDYFNADGGLAAFCANGTRCAARYAVRRRLVAGQEPVVETGWGPISAHVDGEEVTLHLQPLPLPGDPISIRGEGLPSRATPMHVGVPHLVLFVDGDVSTVDVARLAPPLRNHPALPEGANVDFVQILDERIRVRTYERGVERETLACGSGVVASAVVAARQGRVRTPVACGTKSGVDFTVTFEEENGMLVDATLTGDAREVFSADLTEEAWKP
jgi:diaminopimelate epimerase